MEGVEGIGEAIFADILLIGGEILTVAIHIRERVHIIMLEHLVQLPEIGPALIVKVAVADGGADNNAFIAHDAFMPDDLRGEGLHHLNRVSAHAVAVMEVLRHTENHYIIFFLRPGYICALVGDLPGGGHHFGRIAAENGDLAGISIQHRITAEEGMAHFFFHMHTDLVKLGAH